MDGSWNTHTRTHTHTYTHTCTYLHRINASQRHYSLVHKDFLKECLARLIYPNRISSAQESFLICYFQNNFLLHRCLFYLDHLFFHNIDFLKRSSQLSYSISHILGLSDYHLICWSPSSISYKLSCEVQGLIRTGLNICVMSAFPILVMLCLITCLRWGHTDHCYVDPCFLVRNLQGVILRCWIFCFATIFHMIGLASIVAPGLK